MNGGHVIVSEEQKDEIAQLATDSNEIVDLAGKLLKSANKETVDTARLIINRARRLHVTLGGYHKSASVQTALDL